MQQLTKEQAIKFAESKVWQDMTPEQIVQMQLWQSKLAMPFRVFHEAAETVLNRPVYTHEFAQPERLQKEYLGEMQPPSLSEIMAMLPQDKVILAQI